jgi:hypothetical protein
LSASGAGAVAPGGGRAARRDADVEAHRPRRKSRRVERQDERHVRAVLLRLQEVVVELQRDVGRDRFVPHRLIGELHERLQILPLRLLQPLLLLLVGLSGLLRRIGRGRPDEHQGTRQHREERSGAAAHGGHSTAILAAGYRPENATLSARSYGQPFPQVKERPAPGGGVISSPVYAPPVAPD